MTRPTTPPAQAPRAGEGEGVLEKIADAMMRADMIPNVASPEGAALGKHLARMCDGEVAGKPDGRCGTCAFRCGPHLANNSAPTLMNALKCAMEGEPFWCHEHDRACAGWAAMRWPKGRERQAPWPYVEGRDAG